MTLAITIQNTSKIRSIPSKKQFLTWIKSTIPVSKQNCEIVIRIVGTKEIAKLNYLYRKKNQPTNILSFNFSAPPNTQTNFLGDLIICAAIVNQEAELQHKTILAHWAHMTIHGTLHLLGHDHKNKNTAQKMEKLEIKILKKCGFFCQTKRNRPRRSFAAKKACHSERILSF